MHNNHHPKNSAISIGHSHTHRPLEKKRLLWCIIITAVMMLIECVGGWLANSLALMSDAGHMFSHLFSLIVSYAAIVMASRPVDQKRTYGYFRAEILAAFVNGIGLFIVAGIIIYVALERIKNPLSIDVHQMFGVALAGLVVNLVTALMLREPSKKDINIRGAFFHMLGDMLSSVGVVGVAVILYFTDWFVLDPIVSVIIALVISVWAVQITKDSIHVLMESTPKHIQLDEITKTLKQNIPNIKEVHDVHVWEITSKMYALTAHIVVDDCAVSTTTQIIKKCQNILNEKFDIEHSTIQIECLEVPLR